MIRWMAHRRAFVGRVDIAPTSTAPESRSNCSRDPNLRSYSSGGTVNLGGAWPCCMDQGCGRNAPSPVRGSCDADGLRASQLQHAVQDRDADVHLGCLTLVRA